MTDEVPSKRYTRDPRIQRIVDDVRESTEFDDCVRDFKIIAVFAKGERKSSQEAGRCRKVSAAVRLVTGLDFILIFWTIPWDEMTNDQRHQLVIHEIYHIDANDDGEPRLRLHGGDFCEIPEHDKVSMELAQKISMSPSLGKFDRQAKITETGP